MSTEFVGIELQLMGADGVRRDLENLDKLLNSFRGRKKFDMGLSEARQQVIAFKGELEKLKREQSRYEKGSDEWKRYAAAIDEARQKLWGAQQAVREFGLASREAGLTFKETFNSISSKVAHIGSAMQSFGNAMTQLTSPFRRLTSGILMGAGFKVFNSFTEGFERGFTRYDTMKKYPKIMAAFGYSAEQAQESINALDMSVRGLPTGLDEMVDLAQRFTATTGDIEKGTKLAIAANNAFLASMSTDTQKYQGMMQLQDVLGGKDMNAREWNSLVSSMTPAIVKMGESMGYTKDNMKEFIQTIRDGKMDNQEFIDQLIKIGNEGGVLEAMAQESKNTWQAFFANIGNASSRMLAGIIQAFDEISQSLTGKDVNQLFADTIIPSIDNATKSVKEWIKAHPEEITNFFKNLSKIKVGNFFKGYAKGFELMIGLVEKLATALGDHPKLMSALGWFFGIGGMLGRATTIFGGLLKGTRHIWGGIGAGGSWLLKGKLGKIGIFGKIAQIFGKKKSIEEAGEIGQAVMTASPKLLSAFKNMALISGIVAMPAFTAWGVTAAVKNSIKNFKDTIDLLKDMDWSTAAKLAGGIATFLGASAGLGAVVGKFGVGAGTTIAIGETVVGVIMSIATGFADLNMAFIKGSIEKFVESIKLLQEIPDVTSFGDVKAKITNAIALMNEITTLFNGEWTGPGMHEGGVSNVGLGAVWGINSLANALEPMKDAVTRINELAAMSIPEGAVESIGNIIDAISQIQSKMWVLMGFGFGNIKGNMTNVADAMYELRRAVYHIKKLGNEKISKKGLNNITSAIKNIRKAFDAKAIGSIRGTITAFVASIEEALAELGKLNKTIKINAKVELASGFDASVTTVKQKIAKARQDIKNLTDPLSVVVPVSVTFSVTTDLASALARINRQKQTLKDAASGNYTHYSSPIGPPRPANGGMIYRAKGGSIPFPGRPIGTDRVPAWLTPGEYVQNKRAVSMFGIDFMRKVNNLDMKGAMNELMHRAGHMANINRGTNITNNNYNNQKVVINNSNAGAGYTFRTASRFVGAF